VASKAKINERFLRINEVKDRVGLRQSQIYLLIQQGKFPAQIKLGKKAAAWVESEVTEWMQNLIKQSRKNTKEQNRA
jgi:prophage regulatory protein